MLLVQNRHIHAHGSPSALCVAAMPKILPRLPLHEPQQAYWRCYHSLVKILRNHETYQRKCGLTQELQQLERYLLVQCFLALKFPFHLQLVASVGTMLTAPNQREQVTTVDEK